MFDRFLNWLASKAPAHRELQRRYDREHTIMRTYARALRDIVITTGGVKVPNGTTKKADRVARQAFDDAMASLA